MTEDDLVARLRLLLGKHERMRRACEDQSFAAPEQSRREATRAGQAFGHEVACDDLQSILDALGVSDD